MKGTENGLSWRNPDASTITTITWSNSHLLACAVEFPLLLIKLALHGHHLCSQRINAAPRFPHLCKN